MLAPILVGLTELRQNERAPSEDAALEKAIFTRAQQLIRMQRNPGNPVLVVPGSLADHTLAVVGALLLGARGINAQPWLQPTRPGKEQLGTAWIRAGTTFNPPGASAPKAELSILGDEDDTGLAELLEGDLPTALAKLVAKPG